MQTSTSLPRWGQVTAGSVLIAVAVTAGATSLAINTSHGWESGLATAITFGLADVGKIVIPITCAVIGWTMQTRLTLLACAVISLLCAASYYADLQGKTLLARQHAADISADAGKQVSELEADLASTMALMSDEAKRKGCGSKCESFRQHAVETSARLRTAREARAGIPLAETSGLAVLAASLSQITVEKAARVLSGIKTALAIVLLESLVYLSIPGARLLARAMRERKPEIMDLEVVEEPKPKQVRDGRGRFAPKLEVREAVHA